ncbi:MAG: hypothetical protein HYR66_18735, partial [Sphingobacteriales bacterium]|nr:hypothetical protein [Sphingobacteriales bacterium]
AFMKQVQEDTTFYKAFRNLHILRFTAINDINMLNKKQSIIASLKSKTLQSVSNGCRTMQVLEETKTGDIYKGNYDWNYYTASLYAGLFFTKGQVCGETNIVKGVDFSAKDKSGMEKHKAQLKMLFFNPGKKIPGIPFIGNKINIFDEEVAQLYDFSIDYADHNQHHCYVFNIVPRENLTADEKSRLVIDNMTTWFDTETMEVIARNYEMSYDAGVYDFKVKMEVEMTHYNEYLVPGVIRYNGNWDVMFKKRERGIFTATLFDFGN